MEELIRILADVSNLFWKCYKEHILNDSKEDFWNNWITDLDKMDDSLREDPVRYKVYLGMVKGYADATSEYMRCL